MPHRAPTAAAVAAFLALSPVAVAEQEAGVQQAPPFNECLRLELSTDKNLYKLKPASEDNEVKEEDTILLFPDPGAGIRATVTLRNSGCDAIYIRKPFQVSHKQFGQPTIEVFDANGEKVSPFWSIALLGARWPPEEKDLLVLCNGDFITVTIGLGQVGYHIQTPGRYRLMASYYDGPNTLFCLNDPESDACKQALLAGLGDKVGMERLRRTQILGTPVWSGGLESNSVWIEVVR